MTAGDFARHEEAWLLLPWLANGRISPADRDKIAEHVRSCTACTKELAFQRRVHGESQSVGNAARRRGPTIVR